MPFSSKRLHNSFSEDDEVGLFYYRDKYGQLRVPCGYDFSKKSLNTKSYLTDNEPKAAICSMEAQNGKMSPTALFSICLDFVAKNIIMVESLNGFPEIVGKALFNRVQINGGFPRGCRQMLQLFSDAYGSVVLYKLNLKNQYLEVNEIDFLQCFPCLSELDLSHCRLGSDHELLVRVAKVTSLTKLNLKDNCLKDSDLKYFTLPLRVMGVGPRNLSFLDLSYNPGISDLSIRHLRSFSRLNALNLSGTSVTMAGGVARLIQETNLAFIPTSTEFNCENEIKTEGWASSVVNDWLSKSKQCLIKRNQETADGKTKSFYLKKTKKPILKDRKEIKVKKETGTKIFLVATKEKKNGNLKEESREWSKSGSGRSKFSSKLPMVKLGSTKVKRKPPSDSCSYEESENSEDDMMDSYLKSNVSYKKRKLSLADVGF